MVFGLSAMLFFVGIIKKCYLCGHETLVSHRAFAFCRVGGRLLQARNASTAGGGHALSRGVLLAAKAR